MLSTIDFESVLAARHRLQHQLERTPVLTSHTLNAQFGCQLFFKCENFQTTGAFKFRGASNAILNSSASIKVTDVATHSSGNHGAALALAAARAGIAAHVVVPKNASRFKRQAIERYGARIIDCEPTQADREATLAQVVAATHALAISPYEHPDVIAGQGTCALEFLEAYPDLEVLITPVGGGGLLSGSALAARGLKGDDITIIGAEPAAAKDAYLSFTENRRQTTPTQNTICDGLRAQLGAPNFSLIRQHVDQILLASETQILQALHWLWSCLKVIVEPSAAVTLACIMAHPERFQNQRVGVILTGGNVVLADLIPKVYPSSAGPAHV